MGQGLIGHISNAWSWLEQNDPEMSTWRVSIGSIFNQNLMTPDQLRSMEGLPPN